MFLWSLSHRLLPFSAFRVSLSLVPFETFASLALSTPFSPKAIVPPKPTLNIPFQQGGRSGRWGRVARKRRVWRMSGNHRQCFCGSETLQPGCFDLKCRSCDTDSSTSQPKPCWSWNAARVAGNSRQMCPNTGEGGLHTA